MTFSSHQPNLEADIVGAFLFLSIHRIIELVWESEDGKDFRFEIVHSELKKLFSHDKFKNNGVNHE